MNVPNFAIYYECQQIIEQFARAHGVSFNVHAMPLEAQQLFAMLIFRTTLSQPQQGF